MNKNKLNKIICGKDGYVSGAFLTDVGLFIVIFIILSIVFTHQKHPDASPLRSAFIMSGVLFLPIRMIISTHAELFYSIFIFLVYFLLIALGYQYIGGMITGLIVIALFLGVFIIDLFV